MKNKLFKELHSPDRDSKRSSRLDDSKSPEKYKRNTNFLLDLKSPGKGSKSGNRGMSRVSSGLSETIDPDEVSLRESHLEGI